MEEPSQRGSILANENLQTELENLRLENADLQIMLETITEHSTEVEAELEEKNELMRLYIEQVDRVTAAAAEMEAGRFKLESLDEVAARTDELGQLARVFQQMARQVAAREQQLVQQLEQLKVEIDLVKRDHQVAQITESDYFYELQQKARLLRRRT
jgi:DNA repair ATPase RecN